ncbi:hypothetical protein B4135_3190 [Caldibacillus debilis]|uniref:Uncharacterized protein n=1 Tax=Caldibacillus debilis TaxID=301148 RepID=A0A150LH22_9BACI|nr:hypothetical protein B4135_3190 [Caldibacillus debilis]
MKYDFEPFFLMKSSWAISFVVLSRTTLRRLPFLSAYDRQRGEPGLYQSIRSPLSRPFRVTS